VVAVPTLTARSVARLVAVVLCWALVIAVSLQSAEAHAIPPGAEQSSLGPRPPDGHGRMTDAARQAAQALTFSARLRPDPAGPSRWSWPVTGRPTVVRSFDPPAQRWLSGHRGLDVAAARGSRVRVVADGQVRFAGLVAGVGVVSVSHDDGLVSTYQPVRVSVRRAEVVVRGQALGHLLAKGSHCAPEACLHLGARRDVEYVDPMLLLGAWEVSLLPVLRAADEARGLGPGVGLAVGRAKSARRDVGIDLGRGQAGMAEDLLDGPDIGTTVEQVGCGAVA